jgi:hypothetical protein
MREERRSRFFRYQVRSQRLVRTTQEHRLKLNKHRITVEIDVGGVLNNANPFPIVTHLEDIGVLGVGAKAADAREFHFVLAGIPHKLNASRSTSKSPDLEFQS